jgi:hypothetical protein
VTLLLEDMATDDELFAKVKTNERFPMVICRCYYRNLVLKQDKLNLTSDLEDIMSNGEAALAYKACVLANSTAVDDVRIGIHIFL